MAISTSLRNWDSPVRAALVNSYGAAGSNAAIICCEAPKLQPQPLQRESRMQSSPNWPIILGTKSTTSLKRYKNSLVDYLTKTTPQPLISSIASTLSERRQRHKHYVVFEASNTPELIKCLTFDEAQKPTLEQGAPKSVVLTFGGQSKQAVGLERVSTSTSSPSDLRSTCAMISFRSLDTSPFCQRFSTLITYQIFLSYRQALLLSSMPWLQRG